MSSGYRVYIPTRNRHANVEKVVPRWLAQGFDVVLVVDPREFREHRRLVVKNRWYVCRPGTEEPCVKVIAPEAPNAGFGYQCDFAARHARNDGLDTFVLCDDDLMPKTEYAAQQGDGYAQLLVDELRARPDYLGLGAVRDYHNFLTKGAIAEHFGEVVLCPSGWGQQCYALNTRVLFDVGGFDTRLTCFGEGHDLIRKSITKLHKPWLVHAGVYMQALGKRYAEGGLETYACEIWKKRRHEVAYNADPLYYRKLLENECKAIIYADYPKYTTPSGRVLWQKMLDAEIPHWRDMSALHGGALDAE